MSVTDFLNINIQEQDDDTQMFNLIKRVASSFKFNYTTWVPQALVFPSLDPLTLPVLPTLFAYIKNIGTVNIGIEIAPFAAPTTPPSPPPSTAALNLLGPGGIFLLSVPDLAGAGMITPGGPFPANISGGIQAIFLEASVSDPAGTGVVEYFLGG